jgi:hypothetical protein
MYLAAPSTSSSSYFILVPGGLINVRLWPKGKTLWLPAAAPSGHRCQVLLSSSLLLLELKEEKIYMKEVFKFVCEAGKNLLGFF